MLVAGQQVSARFTLVRHLGTGGHGSVWVARDGERPDEPVAVKVLHSELTRDTAELAAVEEGCERVRALRHPAILRIDGLYRSATDAWVAMEYAPGGDLTRLRGQPLAQVLRAALPVAGALTHAHARGVVHRDVKAGNVLLMSDGSSRLADFAWNVAAAGRWPGSPYCTSPQRLEGEPGAPTDDVYAFGALLYELLSGYPPLYPGITPERVRTERPASLATRCAVPPALSTLVDGCLEKRPADRPDMSAVHRSLAEVLAEGENASLSPRNSGRNSGGNPGERIAMSAPDPLGPPRIVPPADRSAGLRGQWQRTPAPRTSEDELRWQGFRRGLLAAALVLALGGLLFVFFGLPKWVPQQEQAASADSEAGAPADTAAPAPEPEVDLAALAKARLEAEQQRTDLDPRFVELREHAAAQWGGEDFERAQRELASGDERFAARDYFQAVEHYNTAEPLIEGLENRMGAALEDRLAAGGKALEEGRSAEATAAFELAALIEPGNKVAAQGLKRARTLDEVRALIAQAEQLEEEGNGQAAAEAYRKALALDGAASRAAEGLARVNARLAGDAFASAMARGFSALTQADYRGARQAFEAAGKIRPGASEVNQALKQVEQEERTQVIAAKLDNARDLEGAERWADALEEYRAVLELDSTVAAAQEGVARVAPRAELNKQLELYATQPERLFSAPVRQAARQSLQRAAAIADPGPVLERQVETVTNWLARAETPVRVALQSDNLTQVTIHRVGTLGTFEQHSLELAPGNYTVVGTRAGFRDVRREIDVLPGEAMPPIVIRCEDRI